MIGAVVRDNIVENIIVLDAAQEAEISAALGCEIVDARVCGLAIGDLRTPSGWTRNEGGEQVILPVLPYERQDGFEKAVERAEAAEAQVEAAAEASAAEALAILSGEVEA